MQTLDGFSFHIVHGNGARCNTVWYLSERTVAVFYSNSRLLCSCLELLNIAVISAGVCGDSHGNRCICTRRLFALPDPYCALVFDPLCFVIRPFSRGISRTVALSPA